jgi:hypothetical protein
LIVLAAGVLAEATPPAPSTDATAPDTTTAPAPNQREFEDRPARGLADLLNMSGSLAMAAESGRRSRQSQPN